MAHVLACGDVITGCSAVLSGPTESELLQKVADHAAEDHEITEITPEVLEAVRAAIRTE